MLFRSRKWILERTENSKKASENPHAVLMRSLTFVQLLRSKHVAGNPSLPRDHQQPMMMKLSMRQKWLEKGSNLVGLTSSTAFNPLFTPLFTHFPERFFIFAANYRYIYLFTKLFNPSDRLFSTYYALHFSFPHQVCTTHPCGRPSIFSPYNVFMSMLKHDARGGR